MISAVTAGTLETQTSFVSSGINAREGISSQRAKEANQLPTNLSEVAKASQTALADTRAALTSSQALQTSQADAVSAGGAGSKSHLATHPAAANLATDQAPSADSLVGATTYNSLGQIEPVHSGTGHVFSAAA